MIKLKGYVTDLVTLCVVDLDVLHALLLVELIDDLSESLAIFGSDQRIACTSFADTSSTAWSVDVCIDVHGDLIMDDVLNWRNIESSRCNIGADEDAVLERMNE